MRQYVLALFDETAAWQHWRPNATAGPVTAAACRRFWDPARARLDPCTEPYIFLVPACIALVVLFLWFARSLLPVKPPIWTVNFIKEDVSAYAEPAGHSKHWTARIFSFTQGLLLASFVGLICPVLSLLLLQQPRTAVPEAVSWAIVLVILAVSRPKTTPFHLLLVYCLIFAIALADLLNEDESPQIKDVPRIVSAAMAALAISITLIMPMRHPKLPTEGISRPFTSPTSALRSPEDTINLLQWMLVTWMGPLVALAHKRQLEDEDVWKLPYQYQHTRVYETFRTVTGSVFWRLVKANGIDLIITTVLGFTEMACKLSEPVLLQQLLRAMGNEESRPRGPLVFAVIALAVRLVQAQLDVFATWYQRRCYERSRGEMITILYEKALNRKIIGEQTQSNSQEGQEESASAGKLLNILRGDAYEVAQRFWEFYHLIIRPIALIVSIVLIWNLIGWPCLLGVVAIFVAQGINVFITRALFRREKQRRAAIDDRLKTVSQFVEAIRYLRYNSWESHWREDILEARQKELRLRVISRLLNLLISFTNNLASGMFPVLAFLAFTVIAKRPLRVDIAFPALQLFNILERNLRAVPDLITSLLNAWVAMGRIETLMAEPDRDTSDEDESRPLPKALELSAATFAWPGKLEPVLDDVSLKIPTGLTVIHGKVGAGKSALLQALLGELDKQKGTYHRPAAVMAYCAQTPWLQHMSIRENILFSAPYDAERYRSVLNACALTIDLANFPNGDLSFIGENGVGLSGGQRARVALARAVYSNAPYLLLDDPISALDQQTAEHIVEKCIVGPLCRDRTVVLVTHRTDLVAGLANQVLDVSSGRVQRIEDLAKLSEDDSSVLPKQDLTDAQKDENERKQLLEETADAVKDKFIEEEKRAHGSVKFHVYWTYIKAGKLKWWASLILVLTAFRFFSVVQTWFLKAWGEAYDRSSTKGISDELRKLPSPEDDIKPWLVGFFVFSIGEVIMFSVTQIVMLVIIYVAAKKLFKDIMERVSNASFRFYDITPVGRLMNRMTSDISVVDGNISSQFQYILFQAVTWISSVVVIATVTPLFLLFSVVVTTSFVMIFLRYLPASQALRRLEMASLTPLMANFGALTEGLLTIRAFRAQRRFQTRVIEVVDTFQKFDHFYWSLQSWLMLRFDGLSAISTFILTILAIYTNISAGLTAFALIAASDFVVSTHMLCRHYGQLEMDFTSVERVVELLQIDQEPSGTVSPPAAWPTRGEITFDNVNVRYAEHLDFVLRDITFTVPAGASVAVVGRTGSGKSTLALSLLAAVRPTLGTITLDGIDITTVAPAALRNRVTFLSQDPTLFVGSLRMNLDPVGSFSDAECEAVLDRLGVTSRYGWTLDTRIEAGGKNLSQGQRQLVQLSRAMLRRSPLIILDEATASIDLGTSAEVQQVLRQEMQGSTVVTIAHRKEAVKGAQWVLELESGRMVRFERIEQVED